MKYTQKKIKIPFSRIPEQHPRFFCFRHDEIFHINIRCATYLTQLVIPFLERQNGGNIINIASISGITGDYQGTYYGISKAGIISLTQYTATQMGKKNIRCNAIAPGLILTPAALNNLTEKNLQIFLRHNALP